MERRKFLTGAALGAGASLAAPAVHAQGLPTVKWRMVASFPKSLDTCYGSTDEMCRRIGEMTDGKFEIRLFGPGEIVPGLQTMDAVSNGTVEAGQAFSSFYFGKDPALIFDAGLAFGLNPRQQAAWMYYGGGLQMVREQYAKHNCMAMPCGNFGVQMGGWFRKEIKSVADLKGLKMRIGGFGGLVLARLGVVPQQLAAGDIYPALERGTIDAAEFVGPYDDEKLGLSKVTKYYYSPGWWEGSAQMTALVGLKAWEALPKAYQVVFETAATEQYTRMLANYDAKNPVAIKRLVGSGTQLRWFPKDVMDAAYKATNELFDEFSKKNADFGRFFASWSKFRDEQAAWYRVADHYLDAYTLGQLSRKKA